MQEDKYLWVWVGGASALIVLILGAWWWRAGRLPAQGDVSYDTSTLADEALEGSFAPTLPVPVVTLPSSGKSGHSGAPETVDTVAGAVAGLPDASRFASLLKSSGVASELSGTGPFTLFVPNNEAIALLPPGALDLTAAQLKRLVEYHVVAGKEIDVNLQRAGAEQALSGDMLNFSVLPSDQSARINSAVALKEYKTGNGIVYLINEVLLPPLNPQ
jgi:uncharacterized surface protein with fasciclin (FAS1) repeats